MCIIQLNRSSRGVHETYHRFEWNRGRPGVKADTPDLSSCGEHQVLILVLALPSVTADFASRAVALELHLVENSSVCWEGKAELVAASISQASALVGVVRGLSGHVKDSHVPQALQVGPATKTN